ncbi:MAG: peptide chain release factor N(5)-glutamine methyltransferase [Hoeflea sp.]|uniref:peptide chain release factor N(5)-glutamine methyltransferase n=1 Tax=Hoeflea sp. TaxID=1940281 RepID=UPI0032EB18A8
MAEAEPDEAGTVRGAWLDMRAAFRAAGLGSADLDARTLVSNLAGLEPHQLVTAADLALTEDLKRRLQQAADQRLAGKPVYRILGWREFYGLSLVLSEATLEPRSDTETLVDAVLPFVQECGVRKGRCDIADLGVGAGGIGLALVAGSSRARCLGIDLSATAVATAAANAEALGLSGRYRATKGDWLFGVEDTFDLIVSNPPYIPTQDLASLSREVTDYDPMLALDGGSDGLDAYRIIADQAGARLNQGGLVALEIGIGQSESVRNLFGARGFALAGSAADLGGIDRVLIFHPV